MNLKNKSAIVLETIGALLCGVPYLIVLLLILAIPVGAIFAVMHFIVKFW